MILSTIQTKVAQALAAQPYFTTEPAIPIVTEKQADYEGEIERVVNALGLCLLVLVVNSGPAQNQVNNERRYDDVEVRVRALGDPAFNNTGIQPSDLCEVAAEFLRGLRIFGAPLKLETIRRCEDYAAPVAWECAYKISAQGVIDTTRPG